MQKNIKIHYHIGDLPANINVTGSIAIDCEFMGLNPQRDRLCTLQFIDENRQDAHIIHFKDFDYNAPIITEILKDKNRIKILHFARSDLAFIQRYLSITPDDLGTSIFCTKTASRIARTYTRRHGLKDLCNDMFGVKISKHQQTSDWGSGKFTQEQIEYAVNDVIYLHDLKDVLERALIRENRQDVAKMCFAMIPARAWLDANGWSSKILDYEYDE